MEKEVHQRKLRANRGVGERAKQVCQLGGLRGAGGRGVPRLNVRPCTVWTPKLVSAKKHTKSRLLLASCDLMSCEVFT